VFGRGGEEVLEFREFGVEPSIIPVSSVCVCCSSSSDMMMTICNRSVCDDLMLLRPMHQTTPTTTIIDTYHIISLHSCV
jgi:siroheme synthase